MTQILFSFLVSGLLDDFIVKMRRILFDVDVDDDDYYYHRFNVNVKAPIDIGTVEGTVHWDF